MTQDYEQVRRLIEALDAYPDYCSPSRELGIMEDVIDLCFPALPELRSLLAEVEARRKDQRLDGLALAQANALMLSHEGRIETLTAEVERLRKLRTTWDGGSVEDHPIGFLEHGKESSP